MPCAARTVPPPSTPSAKPRRAGYCHHARCFHIGVVEDRRGRWSAAERDPAPKATVPTATTPTATGRDDRPAIGAPRAARPDAETLPPIARISLAAAPS